MARYKEASAADVRQWAYDTGWADSNGNGVGERGRFSSELITAYNDANKRHNMRYSGGTPQGQVTQTRQRSAQVATRPQSRASNPPASRRPPRPTARPTTTRDAPAPRPVSAPSEARVIRGENEAIDMVRDVIAQLTAAGNVSGEGEPILMHVEGWSLGFAAAS